MSEDLKTTTETTTAEPGTTLEQEEGVKEEGVKAEEKTEETAAVKTEAEELPGEIPTPEDERVEEVKGSKWRELIAGLVVDPFKTVRAATITAMAVTVLVVTAMAPPLPSTEAVTALESRLVAAGFPPFPTPTVETEDFAGAELRVTQTTAAPAVSESEAPVENPDSVEDPAATPTRAALLMRENGPRVLNVDVTFHDLDVSSIYRYTFEVLDPETYTAVEVDGDPFMVTVYFRPEAEDGVRRIPVEFPEDVSPLNGCLVRETLYNSMYDTRVASAISAEIVLMDEVDR